MSSPKLFISYSWTSPDHEAWVLQLATELQESGVEVIFDKWDLKEGHDANAFMEQMVTDNEIKKVVLICDRAYVEKANQRAGGVGTEAQIISSSIYESSYQEKFVAVVKERDESGSAFLPVYYKSRIYIDLSDQTAYSDGFDKLLRWIYDKPLYKKPPLGAAPAFIVESEISLSIATSSRFRRAIEAVKLNRESAEVTVRDYFESLVSQLEVLRIAGGKSEGEFDEQVIASISAFLPYRNETIELIEAIAVYRDSQVMRRALHRLFEGMIPYMESPRELTTYQEWDYDNYKFIIHELFLYCVAIFIRHERYETAAYLMSTDFYHAGSSVYGQDVMSSFPVMRQHIRALEHRNSRLKLNRLSIRADLLEERCKGIGIPFRDLLQADFVLFIRDHLERPNERWHWYPETLLYIGRNPSPFEIFARSRSATYFNEVKRLFGITQKADLIPLLEQFDADRRNLPSWGFTSFWPRSLMGFDQIETKA